MTVTGARATPHGRVPTIVTYATMVCLAAVALGIILVQGRDLRAAPQLDRLLAVDAPGASCLGDAVAISQSGVFVDAHVPGPAGAETAEGELGPRLLRGRIDEPTGTIALDGECLDGRAASLDATLAEDGGLAGDLAVAGDVIPLTLSPAEAGVAGADSERLDTGELVARMFLAVAIVIAASRTVGAAFTKIRQPRVVGEIVAGILLGPSLLGLFAPDVVSYLFPGQVLDVLRIMAQFGLIFFMFLIGLELDLSLVRGSGHSAVLVSHVSILGPFVLGVVLALTIYPTLGQGRFSGFALFMGAAMAITAFPVLARILTETGIYRTRIGTLAMTCAAVDDVTAWCLLAVVVSIAKATGAGDAVLTIGLSVAFIVLLIFAVRPLLSRLASIHERRGRLGPTITASLLVGLLLSAWATETIGIHAIFGAFLLGAVLPRSTAMVHELTSRLEDLTVLFLLPIFFAIVGLSTSVGLLDQPEHWLILTAILVVAVAGKWGGSLLAARVAGEPWREANTLGILMNTRGLTEIVILTVGRQLGVIPPALFTAMVLMALVTTFMATPLLTFFYPRRVVELEAAKAAALTGAPTPVPTLRYRVLVGIGDLENAPRLLGVVRHLRDQRGDRPEVILARVAPPPGREEVRANLSLYQAAEAEARATLTPFAGYLIGLGFDTRVRASVADDAGEELVRLAALEGVDLVVLGWHRAFLGRNQLGGVVRDVLEHAGCDVAVMIDRPDAEVDGDGPIAVPYGGGVHEQGAFDLAVRLARGIGTPVQVLTLHDADAPTANDVDVEQTRLSGPGRTAIVAAVADASLVVMGRSETADPTTFGPGREGVIAEAAPPVLVVQRGSAMSQKRRQEWIQLTQAWQRPAVPPAAAAS